MTTIEQFEARLTDLLAEVRTVAATPRAAVDPDGMPSHVAPGELIESAWGNAVVDNLHAALAGNLIIRHGITNITADSSGNATITFPVAFPGVGLPTVVATVAEVQANCVVYALTLSNFGVQVHNLDSTPRTGAVTICWSAYWGSLTTLLREGTPLPAGGDTP